jgi:hypothetical protein
MTHQSRIRIAAVATALFLGGMTATGVALRSEPPPSAGAPATAPPAQTVEEVRTETIVEPAPRPAPAPPPQTRQASVPAPVDDDHGWDDDGGHGRGRGRGRGGDD